MKAFAELSDDGQRIEVHFPYSPAAIKAIKGDPDDPSDQGVPGRRFVPREKGGPFWTVPLNLESGKALRNTFGAGLQLGDALKSWGIEEKRRRRELRTLARADDADLVNLPKLAPQIEAIINGDPILPASCPEWLPWDHPIFAERDARSYQRADIAMMAQDSCINANAPGTGKTLEYVGSQAERGEEAWTGVHLVCGPVPSHFDTWVTELLTYNVPGTILYGENPAERREAIKETFDLWKEGEPVWLIVGYDDLRVKKWAADDDEAAVPEAGEIAARDYKGNIYVFKDDYQKLLYSIKYKSFVVDESHKSGLPNRLSLFHIGSALVEAERRYSMSGTPMGGQPIRLWGHLHWIKKKQYSSMWNWAGHWLVIDENDYGKKEIGGILPGREEDFYNEHSHELVRREKRDALPGLPPKVIIEVLCDMTPKQKKQYKQFERDAEITIGEDSLSASIVLAEYTRLKSFANSVCTIQKGKPGKPDKLIPTEDSGKLPILLEKLDENGVRKTEPEPRARAIVGCEGVELAGLVARYLERHGIGTGTMTGATKPEARKAILREFRSQREEPYVIVMTIDTGGVSLNLEQAGSMHALDEKWNPDDMIQFEDRGDRGSRKTALRCYYYRTKETIQEYIHEVAQGKAVTNDTVLDLHRRLK